MKFHSKLTITNMFTLHLNENHSIAPPPPKGSSELKKVKSKGSTPSNSELPPAFSRPSRNVRLETSNSDGGQSKSKSERGSSSRQCKSGECYTDMDRRCINNDSFCPFAIFKDHAKDRFALAKPPLPVPKPTEDVRPASPVLRAQKDGNNNLGTYQNRQNKFLEDILNTRPTKMAPSVELSPKSRLPFGLSSLFKPTEPKEPLKVVYEKEKEFCRNLPYEGDVCSSGQFLLGDQNRGGSAVARAGEEAPRRLATDNIMSFAKSHEVIDLKYPPTTELPSSTMPSGLQSLETLQKLKRAASASCRPRNSAGQIPNEIQDDMLRIEMLQELRKYKRALSAQIQAQQRLIHMCSEQNLPSEQLTSPALPNHIQDLMDQSQKDEIESKGREIDQPPNAEHARASALVDEKPWEADLAHQMLSLSFMEPHFMSHGAELELTTQQNPSTTRVNEQFWLTPPPINQASGQGHNSQSYGELKSNSGQVRAHTPGNPRQKLILARGRLLEGLQNFCPTGGFKIADSSKPNSANLISSIAPETSLFLDMLRKPVSVSKPRSTPQPDFSQAEAFSTQGMASLQLLQRQKETGDKPSPFFPGLSGQIDMKIQSPQEARIQSQPRSQQKGGDIDGELEELSKLLSQLPVITRQQKAEEFASKPLIPPTPETDPESDISMVPHVSSNGTVTASDRPEGDDRNQMTEEDEEIPLRNVDTNKMSVSELVTLGKKIYQILSQLSTKAQNSRTVIRSGVNIVKSCSPTSSRNGNHLNNNNVGKRQSKSVTGARLQDNQSASSFITGPGRVPTKTNLTVGSSSKPSLRKVFDHPPTRWAKRSESLNPPPVSMNSIGRQQSSYRRSTTSMQSATGPGIYKQPQTRVNNRRSSIGIVDEKNTIIQTSSRHSRIKMRYSSNNIEDVNPITKRYQRQLTPYAYQSVDETNPYIATISRDNSKGRNFIHENIAKARLIKKLSNTTSLSPKPLPPVPKIYENIQSVVDSRSRSGERDRSTSTGRTTEEKRRARSLTPIREERLARKPSPLRYSLASNLVSRQTGTDHRASTADSIVSSSTRSIRRSPKTSRTNLVDFQHQVSKRLKVVSHILNKSSRISKGTSQSGANKATPASKPSLPGRTIAKTNSVGNSSKVESYGTTISRKSRSKTKRDSQIAKELRFPFPSGMATENMKITGSKSSNNNGGRKVGGNGSVISGATFQKKTEGGLKNKIILRKTHGKKTQVDEEAGYFEGDPAENKSGSQNLTQSPFTTISDQQLIREMVKTEMNMMVESHVRDVLKQKKVDHLSKPETKQMKTKMKQIAVPPSDESEFEHITPIYTPPRRLHDESLFFIEKWINPEGSSYTSAKDTPAVSDTEAEGSGGDGEYSKRGKAPTVRFSLPAKQSRKVGK